MPINLPPHVHVIISTLIEIESIECVKSLKAKILDESHFVELPVLGEEVRVRERVEAGKKKRF